MTDLGTIRPATPSPPDPAVDGEPSGDGVPRRRRSGRRRWRPAAAVGLVAVIVSIVVVSARPDPASSPSTGSGSRDVPSPGAAMADVTGLTDTRRTLRPKRDEPDDLTIAPKAPPVGITPDPTSLLVLVDHQRRVPPGWVPPDLVEPAVPFTFSDPEPKRLLRQVAARALEQLVGAAATDGIGIAVVSGYRSEAHQQMLYAATAGERGDAVASTTSAWPGHSEHQTGLAVDVTSSDGRCPAEPCFAGTPAAAWLAANAHRFGFVVRYPAGAQHLTGYQYEPWHLRYVGTLASRRLADERLTLDQLLGAA